MKKINNIFKPFVILLIIIFLIMSFYDFIDQSNHINTSHTLDHLKDVGKQTANIFNQKYQHLSETIKGTALIIENSFEDENDINKILKSVNSNNSLYKKLWYVNEDKEIENYNDDYNLNIENKYINNIFKGMTGFTEILNDKYNDKEVIAAYSPINNNNKVVGGIIGIIEINRINKDNIYTDIFNDTAYVFTITKEGKIISKINNQNTLYDGENYLDFLNSDVVYDNGDSYEKLIKDLNNNKSNYIRYSQNSYSRVAYYTPIEINDWYTFTIISGDIIDNKNSKLNNISFFLVLKIFIVFLLMLFLIIRYFIKNNRERDHINSKLNESRKKLEMILKQTSDRIFEYDTLQDSLILDSWNEYPKIMLNNFLMNIHNYNFVSKEHESLLINKFKSINKENNKVMFDAKLPYISKDLETWYHISMIYDDENKKAIGTLKNSTKEMKEYLLLLQDQMFKNQIYSQSLSMFAFNIKSKKIVIYQENGIYQNVMDIEYEKVIEELVKRCYEKDIEKVKEFFDYDNIRNIYHRYSHKDKIEYRTIHNQKDDYLWIRFKIQFERQSSNNELLMIAYANDINKEKKKQLEIEFKANRDGLTGLYNKQTFHQLVKKYLLNLTNSVSYNAYMIIDLDNFKKINDNLGHNIGDEVIKEVSHVIEINCGIKSYIGRFGGDEFVVFLYQQQSYAEIEKIASQIINDIKKIKDGYQVNASIGICFVNDEKDNDKLFVKADKALYISKNNGKGKFTVYKENKKI